MGSGEAAHEWLGQGAWLTGAGGEDGGEGEGHDERQAGGELRVDLVARHRQHLLQCEEVPEQQAPGKGAAQGPATEDDRSDGHDALQPHVPGFVAVDGDLTEHQHCATEA